LGVGDDFYIGEAGPPIPIPATRGISVGYAVILDQIILPVSLLQRPDGKITEFHI
jgi:hypothetical protein